MNNSTPGERPGLARPSHQNNIRRDIVVAGLCLAAAAPSFSIAVLAQYDIAAMVVGVLFFTTLMIVIARTPGFHSFTRQRFVRRTLHAVYGLRLLISLGTPLLFLLDAIPGGMVVAGLNAVATSLGTGSDLSFLPPSSYLDSTSQPGRFLATLILVLAQGVVLNLMLACIFVPALIAQRALARREPEPDATAKSRCLQCRHSLLGLPAGNPCPECGWDQATTPPSRIERFSTLAVTLGTVTIVVAVCLLSTLLSLVA